MHFLLTKKLKYFMTVMEKKCLTKASEDLFITRSPLGKAINELETLLGEKLFLREHGLYEPTLFAQEVYEQALPLYHKLLNLEEYFLNSCQSRHINIILDTAFPDNLADIISSSLNKTDFLFHLSRKPLIQDDIDNIEPGPDTLFITHKDLVAEPEIQEHHTLTSSLLLVMNNAVKSVPEDLSNVPLIFRSNVVGANIGRITSELQKSLGFVPKIRYINGSVFDCLLMAGEGSGIMLLPLKTCELININRKNTLLLNNLTIKINYYHRKKIKNKKEINTIINHITALF
ncbi:MAG TPA: LysR family transcriptional regulator [Scandinavium sp.]|jgi:DNA-binding transcriptional LysR family regulator|uniref:LysR family transcriptional regulator n=1 Tax=Scandinavium sp. TaxID=2830653 RepID=UPI002E3690CB|nr:LysR family transcriptional regulator [Scandinavium sp.]HEX4504003.1 LysR family transcriptional regulator [Scandinavium sp.]